MKGSSGLHSCIFEFQSRRGNTCPPSTASAPSAHPSWPPSRTAVSTSAGRMSAIQVSWITTTIEKKKKKKKSLIRIKHSANFYEQENVCFFA